MEDTPYQVMSLKLWQIYTIYQLSSSTKELS